MGGSGAKFRLFEGVLELVLLLPFIGVGAVVLVVFMGGGAVVFVLLVPLWGGWAMIPTISKATKMTMFDLLIIEVF